MATLLGMAQPKAFEIDIETAYGRLKGRVSIPPRPIRLSELAFNFLGLDDQLIRMAEAADRKTGHQVSCAKGCSACCSQIVPVSPAEAWMLADLVRALPPGRREAVVARFQAARDRLAAEAFGDTHGDGEKSRTDLVGMAMDYQALDIACPFLEDHACSIHPQRPAICREFLATTPASNCRTAFATPVRSVPLAARFTECLSKVCAMAMGGEPHAIPLTLALHWAEENREAGRALYDPEALMSALFGFIAGGESSGDVAV